MNNRAGASTREAAELSGLTYRQVEYWTYQGVIRPAAQFGQGKARVYGFRELTLLRLAVLLREDGHRLKTVKKALALVAERWQSEDPNQAGMLVLDLKTGAFDWQEQSSPGYAPRIAAGASYSISGYDVRIIAMEVKSAGLAKGS